jgi:hypothetical protein
MARLSVGVTMARGNEETVATEYFVVTLDWRTICALDRQPIHIVGPFS